MPDYSAPENALNGPIAFSDEDLAALSNQVMAEYLAGIQYKQGRVPAWQASEDAYFGKVKKALRGRFNVPVPIVPGFIDTLLAKIDDPPNLKFAGTREAQERLGRKIQAAYEIQSTNEDADWETIDLDSKKLACFSGRAIVKYFAESDPKYCGYLRVVDHYDFYCDPMGGGNLENHKFCGEDNIFKSKYDLRDGVKAGLYSKAQVAKLIAGITPAQVVENDNLYQNKANRFAALNLDSKNYNYAGQGLYRLCEAGTTFKGQRVYVLFDRTTGLIIRAKPLKEVFASGLWMYASWATHRDAFNFWSKAPVDDIRPVAEVMRILVNQELDNRQKKNWNQRAYDPEMFPNPAQLEFTPDGLVEVKSGTSRVTEISRGIYQFQTPELQGTINLVQWLDQYIGQKSGITPDAQGTSSEDKVGIYEGNVQAVADRIALYNRSYKKCWTAIGRRFVWGLKEHLTEKMAVKLTGEEGVEWDELGAKEIDPNIDIKVTGGSAEAQDNESRRQRRLETLTNISKDPSLAGATSAKWRVEQMLLGADFTDEEVRQAMDTANFGNREVMAKAAEDIEDIIEGKKPKLYRGANTAYVQKIVDHATELDNDDEQLFNRLMAFAEAHMPIVTRNMARKAIAEGSKVGLTPDVLSARAQALGGQPGGAGMPMEAAPTMPEAGNLPA